MYNNFNQNFQYHSENNLVVIWSAKAACTIVIKMYFEQEGLNNEAKQYDWIHKYREKHSIENNDLRLDAIQNPKTKYIQFVVNPYRRAVSSYIHAMRHKYLGYQYENLSFTNFLDKLENKMLPNDMHHNKQTFILYKQKQIEYIKMEDIHNQLPYINKKYGLNYKLKTSNHYSNKVDSGNYFVGNMLWNEIQNKIPKDYTNFYNKKNIDKVGNLYSEDIQNFNYTYKEFETN